MLQREENRLPGAVRASAAGSAAALSTNMRTRSHYSRYEHGLISLSDRATNRGPHPKHRENKVAVGRARVGSHAPRSLQAARLSSTRNVITNKFGALQAVALNQHHLPGRPGRIVPGYDPHSAFIGGDHCQGAVFIRPGTNSNRDGKGRGFLYDTQYTVFSPVRRNAILPGLLDGNAIRSSGANSL